MTARANPSLLESWHREHAAAWMQDPTGSLPAHFGDPNQELEAARSTAALFDLGILGVMEITGSDATDYLQGQISNRVPELGELVATPQAITTPKGKLVATGVLWSLSDRHLFVVERQAIEPALARLQRFAITEDVNFQNVTDQFGLAWLLGPAAQNFAADELDSPAAGQIVPRDTGDGWVSRQDLGQLPGWVVLVPAESFEDLWTTWLAPTTEIRPMGTLAWDYLRLEAGLPRLDMDMLPDQLLPETGLEQWAVDFDKGCYTGQEIIARVHYRGQVHHHLVGVTAEDSPIAQAGDTLFSEENDVGHLTSVSATELSVPMLGLALVKHKVATTGRILTTAEGGTWRITSRPLLTPPGDLATT